MTIVQSALCLFSQSAYCAPHSNSAGSVQSIGTPGFHLSTVLASPDPDCFSFHSILSTELTEIFGVLGDFHFLNLLPQTGTISSTIFANNSSLLGAFCHGESSLGFHAGIDYDGSKSGGSDMSVGYGLDEYAYAVVRAVQYVCDRKGIGHPIICSESGRALISHHSVLVFEAVSAPAAEPAPVAGQDMAHLVGGLTEEAGAEYTSLSAAVARGDYSACLVHAEQLKVRCVEMFKDGMIGMEQLAAVDGLCDLVFREIQAVDPIRTYHVNMSVFTSVPDFWAIGQLFPIVPIHRLDEKPEVKGVLSDLTCDSDGKIDRFIGGKGSLQLHEARGRYCLGMFLGGAYQEALGGMHNLFGGPSVVRVERSEGAHCFAVTGATPGATCADVLRAMQYEPEVMYEALRRRAEECGGGSEVDVRVAKAFNSMPYLVLEAEAAAEEVAGAESGSEVVSDEDDGVEWDMMRGLTM